VRCVKLARCTTATPTGHTPSLHHSWEGVLPLRIEGRPRPRGKLRDGWGDSSTRTTSPAHVPGQMYPVAGVTDASALAAA